MSWVVGLVEGVAAALIAGGSAIFGARIGAKATRDATTKAFEQQSTLQNEAFQRQAELRDRELEEERKAWRVALWHECCQDIHFDTERPAEELWTYETSMLSEAPRHASAFSPTVLQRIIWARTANERLEQLIDQISTRRRNFGTLMGTVEEATQIRQARSQFMGEISEIEKALRDSAPTDSDYRRD